MPDAVPHSVPRNLVERAADAAFEAAAATLDVAGAQLDKAFIMVDATGTPAWEPDCVTAGSGFDDPASLLVMLVGHLAATAEAVGLKIVIAPMRGGEAS